MIWYRIKMIHKVVKGDDQQQNVVRSKFLFVGRKKYHYTQHFNDIFMVRRDCEEGFMNIRMLEFLDYFVPPLLIMTYDLFNVFILKS